MARPLEPTAEDAVLELDHTFRREVVDTVFEEAQRAGVPVDPSCRRLLKQYADGLISFPELDCEVVRLVRH